ncbi:MAG TPA: cytochrome c oxidase assembly protein [Steroidobacteraceae bacterium]|jgi:putative membrane protein|nr:cytochrome c oxidase assembly protein [Steroidobacteraceae bacterium]
MSKHPLALLGAPLFLAAPASVLAHGDELQAGEPIMAMWQFEPEIVAGLVIAAALYVAGVRRGAQARWWRHALFFAGLAALALALLSPIEPLADHVFVIHQVEHMLLRSIGPMLLLLAQPQAALMRGMPGWLRRGAFGPLVSSPPVRSVFGFFSQPVVATVLFVGVSWFWMIPRWHDVAILNEAIHYGWHVSLLVTGLFFFSVIFDPRSAPTGPRLGTRLVMFWCAAMGNILLGAFLTFKAAPLYHAYDVMGRMFGLDAVTDEQVGGLTMWIPGCMMFALSAILILHRWGSEEERAEERRKRLGTAEAHAAARAANLSRSNRALAVGLGSFVVLVLFVVMVSAVLYDHELGPGGSPFDGSSETNALDSP